MSRAGRCVNMHPCHWTFLSVWRGATARVSAVPRNFHGNEAKYGSLETVEPGYTATHASHTFSADVEAQCPEAGADDTRAPPRQRPATLNPLPSVYTTHS